MSDLSRQIKYFEDNIDALLKDYEGSILVISQDCKVDAFATDEEAYRFGVENYGLGNFLLRECKRKNVNKVHIITPNIVLA